MGSKNIGKTAGVNLDGLDALAGFGDMSFESLISGQAAQTDTAPAPAGVPLMVKLDDIEEDPHQLRKRFNLDEMRASIRENLAAGRPPFRVPLIVKPHPDPEKRKQGKYKLGDGARRRRSGKLEGVEEAPVIVDENFDDFDQVVVNLQRDGNTPLEIADFIAQKLKENYKKGDIAKRLGMSGGWLSKHVALIGIPDSIRLAYDENRINDVEAMYLLTTNYEAYADQVDELCIGGTELITKQVVTAALDSWMNPAPSAPSTESQAPAAADTEPRTEAETAAQAPDESPVAGGGGAGTDATVTAGSGTFESGAESASHAAGLAEQPPALAPSASASVPASPSPSSEPRPANNSGKLRKAIVQIRHDERPGRLLLDRRAPVGLAWIKYDDDGAEVEIEIGTATLVGIVEGA